MAPPNLKMRSVLILISWATFGCESTLSAPVASNDVPRAVDSESNDETSTSPDDSPDQSSPPPEPVRLGSRQPSIVQPDGFLPSPVLIPEILGGDPEAVRFRVVVIAHGAGGRGIDHCLFWDPHLPEDMILLCPAGAPLDRRQPDGGSYFPDHLQLRDELVALTTILSEQLGASLMPSWRYVGYSQGATMGALAVVGEMPLFDELVLIEGGGENWTARRAIKFREAGGRRVLLACGTKGCAKLGRRSLSILRAAEVDAEFADAPGVGHTYAGGVGRAVLKSMLAWESD